MRRGWASGSFGGLAKALSIGGDGRCLRPVRVTVANACALRALASGGVRSIACRTIFASTARRPCSTLAIRSDPASGAGSQVATSIIDELASRGQNRPFGIRRCREEQRMSAKIIGVDGGRRHRGFDRQQHRHRRFRRSHSRHLAAAPSRCLPRLQGRRLDRVETEQGALGQVARGTTATYPPIQRWVRRQYGFVPKTCWIAHCKELKGLPTRSNWNRGGARQVPCPENTRSAIYAAFLETGQHAGQPLAWTGEASRIGSGPFPRGVYGGAVSRFKPTSPPPANFRDSTDVHPLDGASVALVREPAGTPRPFLVGRPPLRRCGGAAKFHARCDQRRRLMPNITEANGLRSLNYRRTPKKRTSICGSSRITIPKPPPSPTAH